MIALHFFTAAVGPGAAQLADTIQRGDLSGSCMCKQAQSHVCRLRLMGMSSSLPQSFRTRPPPTREHICTSLRHEHEVTLLCQAPLLLKAQLLFARIQGHLACLPCLYASPCFVHGVSLCRRLGDKHRAVDQDAVTLAYSGGPAAEACLAAGRLLLRGAAVQRPDVAHLCKGHVWPGGSPVPYHLSTGGRRTRHVLSAVAEWLDPGICDTYANCGGSAAVSPSWHACSSQWGIQTSSL